MKLGNGKCAADSTHISCIGRTVGPDRAGMLRFPRPLTIRWLAGEQRSDYEAYVPRERDITSEIKLFACHFSKTKNKRLF